MKFKNILQKLKNFKSVQIPKNKYYIFFCKFIQNVDYIKTWDILGNISNSFE